MTQGRGKITIVGAGNVGTACAAWCMERDLGDLVLVDLPEHADKTRGKALDLLQTGPISGVNCGILGTGDYADTASSDVCVITAGVPRKPGMSREELVAINQNVVGGVAKKLAEGSPKAVLINVTNPLDTMTYVAWKCSGFPKARVVGQAGILDGARMSAFVAQALNVPMKDVASMVLGGHGDEMVPLVRHSTVSGKPLAEVLPKEKLDPIVERTRKGGGELVSLMGTSAWFAPGAAAGLMVEAVLKDRKAVFPCSAYLEGEYGLSGIFFGVPCRLGRGGVEEILELPLGDGEKGMLEKSAALVAETMKALR